MKKTYIQPATLITVVAMQQMICDSTPHVTINTSDDAIDAAYIDSRSTGLWDDED